MDFRIMSLVPSAVQRRRGRQREAASRKTWSYDIVLLRVQLLFAMAAVDGRTVPEELQAIDNAIERAPLPAEQRERLRDAALRLAQAPPRLDPLLESLAGFREDPTFARALVTDLVRVAAIDLHADPREQELLERVCEAVGVDPVIIRVARPVVEAPVERAVRRAPTGSDAVTQERLRESVRKALESSYDQGTG
jgi:uncharacterized tellurite resistance protein B-like protein